MYVCSWTEAHDPIAGSEVLTRVVGGPRNLDQFSASTIITHSDDSIYMCTIFETSTSTKRYDQHGAISLTPLEVTVDLPFS